MKGSFKELSFKALDIKQGYLCTDPARTVRVRVRDDKGFITIKGDGNASGTTRFEWEKEISREEAESLLVLAQDGIIDKTRYLIRNTDGMHVWEVDEFHGRHEGLVIAEIELSAEDEAFDRPSWLGEEVTGDARYYNSYLSRVQPL